MTKVLVTGASGLLGRAVFSELRNAGVTVIGTARSRDHGGQYTLLDLCNYDQTRDLVTRLKPDAIVHCAAERRPDVMENYEQQSRQLNVDATKNLCQAAVEENSWVLYISTDYVFDGRDPPYEENDQRTNPLNKYGLSKRDGEIQCLGVSGNNAVLRVPVLYGNVEQLSESAVTVLFQNICKTDRKCVMSDYERRYPTLVDDLAVVIRQMIEKRHSLNGYFHWSGDEEMTKFDMAITMAKMFNLPQDHIIADKNPGGGASRPYNAKLKCERLIEFGIGQRTPFSAGVKRCLDPWAKQSKEHAD